MTLYGGFLSGGSSLGTGMEGATPTASEPHGLTGIPPSPIPSRSHLPSVSREMAPRHVVLICITKGHPFIMPQLQETLSLAFENTQETLSLAFESTREACFYPLHSRDYRHKVQKPLSFSDISTVILRAITPPCLLQTATLENDVTFHRKIPCQKEQASTPGEHDEVLTVPTCDTLGAIRTLHRCLWCPENGICPRVQEGGCASLPAGECGVSMPGGWGRKPAFQHQFCLLLVGHL